MKALAYQADPSSVPVGPPHRVSPAKASKKVINVEADIIEVIHFLFVYHTTVPKNFKNLIYKSWFSSNLINRRHERQPERLLFKAPLVLNRKTSQYHFHEIPHFSCGLSEMVETNCNLTIFTRHKEISGFFWFFYLKSTLFLFWWDPQLLL